MDRENDDEVIVLRNVPEWGEGGKGKRKEKCTHDASWKFDR